LAKSADKAKTDMMRSICNCVGCPSYKGTGETALLFCLVDKSTKIKKEKGCICGGCPVTKEMKLTHTYYCTRGTEKEQMSKPVGKKM